MCTGIYAVMIFHIGRPLKIARLQPHNTTFYRTHIKPCPQEYTTEELVTTRQARDASRLYCFGMRHAESGSACRPATRFDMKMYHAMPITSETPHVIR